MAYLFNQKQNFSGWISAGIPLNCLISGNLQTGLNKTIFIWLMPSIKRNIITTVLLAFMHSCIHASDVYKNTKSVWVFWKPVFPLSVSAEQCLHLARFCRQVLLWGFVAPFYAIICSEIRSHNWNYYTTLLISEHTHSSTKRPAHRSVCQRPALMYTDAWTQLLTHNRVLSLLPDAVFFAGFVRCFEAAHSWQRLWKVQLCRESPRKQIGECRCPLWNQFWFSHTHTQTHTHTHPSFIHLSDFLQKQDCALLSTNTRPWGISYYRTTAPSSAHIPHKDTLLQTWTSMHL